MCMNQELSIALSSLKEAIENDERVILLNKLDKELNNDEEVMKLAYQKDMAVLDYEDSIKHFGDNSKETLEAQKKLYQAKLALDSHPLVKRYNEAYKEVRLMYKKINDSLFGKLIEKNRCKND